MTYPRIPRTWKPCEDDEALEIYYDVLQEALNLGYYPMCDTELREFKSTTCYGQCRSMPQENSDEFFTGVIGINKAILGDHHAVLSVLVHEIAHSIVPKDGHGPRWKRIAETIAEAFGVEVSVTGDYEGIDIHPEEETKYEVSCPLCGRSWKYQRLTNLVKRPSDYRCPYCKNSLVRTK